MKRDDDTRRLERWRNAGRLLFGGAIGSAVHAFRDLDGDAADVVLSSIVAAVVVWVISRPQPQTHGAGEHHDG